MFEFIIAIIGAILTIAEIMVAVFSYRRSVLDAIWQWAQLDGSPEVIEARKFIQYELADNYNPDDIRKNVDDAATKISPITNAYHHLGILVRKRYIPMSTFKDNSTGWTIVIIYEKLLPYIQRVRNEHNPNYANGFEYLYNGVKKYYK